MTATGTHRLRVILGPVEIAGYYTRLAGALREVGVDAVAIDLGANPYRYEGHDRPHPTVRLAAAAGRRLAMAPPSSLAQWLWRLAVAGTRLLVLGWAIVRFDAFVFGFGQTFLRGHELWLLRALGKRLVFVFNGTDARPPYVDGAGLRARPNLSTAELIRLTVARKRRIRHIERFADAIVSQPAFSHFFERQVVDFFRIGVPWIPAGDLAKPEPGPLRILHSPSDPAVKGTERIRDAVRELKADGLDIELVELHGLPNDIVRREISRSAFVIDQLYSDAPMVGFATEAAAAGRPAIVGGYAWSELRTIYDGLSMPPVQSCHPDELGAAILTLVGDAGLRENLGAKAKAFVEGNWARWSIASRYVAIIEGNVEPGWLYDPRRLRYVRGVGLAEDDARASVAAVLAVGGRRALQVSDKPELEQAFVDFASGVAGA